MRLLTYIKEEMPWKHRILAVFGVILIFSIGIAAGIAILRHGQAKPSRPPPPLAAPSALSKVIWSKRPWITRNEFGSPGPCRFSGSDDVINVGNGLQLSIAKYKGRWRCSQLMGEQSLGYGTYRWTIASDLSKIDPYEVLGLFVWDDTKPGSHNEIDIEASRWGEPRGPTGSVTYWYGKPRRQITKSFNFTARPPYQAQFFWRPKRLSFYVADRTGKPLLDVTYHKHIPRPRKEVVMMNYWRVDGVNPTVKKTLKVTSFVFEPLGKE